MDFACWESNQNNKKHENIPQKIKKYPKSVKSLNVQKPLIFWGGRLPIASFIWVPSDRKKMQ